MQIKSYSHPSLRFPAPTTQPNVRPEVEAVPVRDSVAFSPAWTESGADAAKQPSTPPPALARPVIFLHGFNGSAESWDGVSDWLASGQQPVNKSGGVLRAGEFDSIDPEANLFSLRLSRPYNPVEKNTSELKQAVEAVTRATGASEVDLVVHSLGGLNTRSYLQDPGEKVNKVVMLGTPNRGSQLANMELFFRDKFNYPILPPTDDPEVRTLLKQMTVDRLDREKQPENPFLRALNDDWGRQSDKAEILIVAGAGVPTLSGGPGITAFGDGVVTRSSARMDGVENKTAWFKSHGSLLKSPSVMETLAKFLVGQPLPEGEHLFDSLEDAAKAAQLLQGGESAPVRGGNKATSEEVRQATRLPLLDPAFQIGLGLSVLSAIMGGPKEKLPLVDITLNSVNRQSEVHASYQIDMLKEGNPLQGGGSVGDKSFAEVADLKEGKLHWQSALGLKSSGLIMEVGEDERSITMKGDLGGVPTDLVLSMVQDEEGRLSGMRTTGTFNGDPYEVNSEIDLQSLYLGQPMRDSSMKVTGTVDGEDLHRTYQVKVQRTDKGLHFGAHEEVQADRGQSLGVEVRITDRD